jgi:hypothetical protein
MKKAFWYQIYLFLTQTSESQGGTTITLKPRSMGQPPTVSPAPSSPPHSPSPLGLPPSITPPRLEQEEDRGKRKKVYTETYKLGREQGPLGSLRHSQT